MELAEGRIVYLEQKGGATFAGIVLRVHDDGTTIDMQGNVNGRPVDITDVPFSENTKAGHWSFHPDDRDS